MSRFVILAALITLMAAPRPAPAQGSPWRDDPHLAALPESCEAVIVIRGAGAHRKAVAGRALRDMLRESGTLLETRAAWSDLARALDWDEERAFDELLGRHITLAVDDLSAPEVRWALLSRISAATERRLRDRLHAVPRANAGDMTVLALEHGRLELTVARAPGNGTSPGECAVLLAPAGENALVRSMLAEMRRTLREESLAPARDDLVVLLRDRPAGDARPGIVLVRASARESGWDARLTCSPGTLWSPLPDGPRWSAGPLRELDRGTLLAAIGVAGSAPGSLGRLGGALTANLPFGRDLLATSPGDRLCVLVRQGAHRDGPLSLAVGVEGAATEPGAADARAASILHFLATRETAPLPIQFETAASPFTERRLALDGALPIAPGLAPLLERCVGTEPVLSWIAARPGASARSWWLAALGPERSPSAQVYLSLMAREQGDLRQRLSAGIIRPAAIFEWAAENEGILRPLRPLRRIESFSWDVWARPDGMIEGACSLGFRRGGGDPEPALAGNRDLPLP